MFGKKKRVNVLGAGPAGLLAAYAAARKGHPVTVFSAPGEGTEGKVAKSALFGCQYLHMSIPNLTTEKSELVSYQLSGTPEGYRRKVYGDAWSGQVSPDEYGPERPHQAWDLRKAYDRLWEWAKRSDLMASCRLTSQNAHALYDSAAFIVNTIPLPELCLQPQSHKFITQDIWAMGSLDEEDGRMPYCAPNFTVQCNGFDSPRWYRAATVFGHSTLEWPAGAKPPITGVAAVRKPLSTDCDCYTGTGRWLRAGRYGRWQKGTLVHSAYFDTLGLLS